MTIKTEFLSYTDQGTHLEAFVATPDQKKKMPLVLLCHAWKGRDDFIMEKALSVAKLGYIGFAIDMYGKGVLGKSSIESALLKKPFLEDRDFLLKRTLAGLTQALRLDLADVGQVVVVGYGFGAICALDLARSGAMLKGVISVYGHFLPPEKKCMQPSKTQFLVLHGLDDPIVPKEELLAFEREMKEAQADLQLHLFSNTMHAFATPGANDPAAGIAYNPLSAARAWELTHRFLDKLFS